MSYTKRQFVEGAFSEIGLGSYIFDSHPEKLQAALKSLDAMVATWNGKGIMIGYPLPSSPENSDLDTETGVPDYANEAIIKNLAIRIAPSMGKTVMQDTKTAARQAYLTLLNKTTKIIEQQYPGNLPVGAGNKPSGRGYGRFFTPQDDCCE
jgi:hypothetical protein